MKKILYLNGFQSKLNIPKQEILLENGTLIAPYVDHRNEQDIYLKFEKIVVEEKIDLIIGSSMGGALGFLLSSNHNIPALLFNPAVPYYEGEFKPLKEISAYQKCILGELDSVINPERTMMYLNQLELPTLKTKIISDLAHQIPVNVFKQEIDLFIKEVDEFNKEI